MNNHYRPALDMKHVLANTGAAAGTSTADSDVVDMAQDDGYNGVHAIAIMGAIVDASEVTLKIMGSDADDGSDPVELAAGTAVVGDSSSDRLILLDLLRPSKQYVFARVERATQNATVSSIVLQLYNPRECPVTQATNEVLQTDLAENL